MSEFKKGDRVQRRGYVPATVVTGKANAKGEIMIEFDGSHGRAWHPADKFTLIREQRPVTTVIKGTGLASNGGGFTRIHINGKVYHPDDVAAAVRAFEGN